MMFEEVKKLIESFEERVVGLKQTLRLIDEKRIEKVVLAQDSDPYYTNKVLLACKTNGIEIVQIETSKQLATIVGVAVPTAIVGLIKH